MMKAPQGEPIGSPKPGDPVTMKDGKTGYVSQYLGMTGKEPASFRVLLKGTTGLRRATISHGRGEFIWIEDKP